MGGQYKYPESWATSRPDRTHGGDLLKNANRCFSASAQAKAWVGSKYRNYFTITLRECAYGEDRNSDRVEWWKLAKHITNMGGHVVIVPDTYGKPLKDFPNCVEAAWDIDIRCALYEGALLNMGVANGPMSVAILSQSKFAMLNTDVRELEFGGNRIFPNIPARDLLGLVEPYMTAAA